jgi:hypothetical protein
MRALLTDFQLNNPYYAGWTITVFEVNQNLQRTTTLASVFSDPVGSGARSNPMTLDSNGAFPGGPCYVEKPVILEASNGTLTVDLGAAGLFGRWRGVWATSTLYYAGERVRHPSSPSTYLVTTGHISATFATDLANGLLEQEIDANSMATAAGATLLGTTIPTSPAPGYLRVNSAGNAIEGLDGPTLRSAIQAADSTKAILKDGSVAFLAEQALAGDPTQQLSAAPKQYVDAAAGWNRVTNGDQEIDQRHEGAAQTFTAGAALAMAVDRFYGFCTGANVTGQRVGGTAPNTANYRFTGAASVTGIGYGHRIIAEDSRDLAGSTASLLVDLANTLLTNVTWALYYANSTNTFGSLASPTRTLIATGTFSGISSTITQKRVDVALPAGATTGLELVLSVGAQTSGTWTIGGVGLTPTGGSSAIQRRPFGVELMLCQRFFRKTFPQGTAVAANSGVLGGAIETSVPASVTSFHGALWKFSPPMRAAPTTITTFNPLAAGALWSNAAASSTSTVSTARPSDTGVSIFMNAGTAFSLGSPDIYLIHATADAEPS